jgi:hypothetical protein
MLGDVGRILVPGHDHETGFVFVEGCEQIIAIADHSSDEEGRLLESKVRYLA